MASVAKMLARQCCSARLGAPTARLALPKMAALVTNPGVKRFSSHLATREASPESLLLSDSCVAGLNAITEQGGHLRIMVQGGGCSGFQYKFDFEFQRDGRKFIQSTVNKNVNHALIKRLNLGGDDGHMRNLAIHVNNLMLPMDSAKHSTEEDLAHSQPAIFVVDQSVMLAILEEPLGNVLEPQSTVTLMIRNPSGKSASSINLRPLPRHKSGNVPSQLSTGRLLPVSEPPARPEYQPRFFPEKINRIPLCAADQSVPAVESVAGDERAAMELHKLSRLMEQ